MIRSSRCRRRLLREIPRPGIIACWDWYRTLATGCPGDPTLIEAALDNVYSSQLPIALRFERATAATMLSVRSVRVGLRIDAVSPAILAQPRPRQFDLRLICFPNREPCADYNA